MPIIYTYPSATPVVEDLLIFSDVSATDPAKDTRKCTVGDIVDLVTASVPGGGTVTSVELQLNSIGLTTSGGTSQTIVGTGSFDIAGTLVVDNGGTGAGALTGVIHGNGSGAYTASNVVLTSEVTGVLPILNGGTGQSAYTKGDLLFYNIGGVGAAQLDKLAIGAPNQILTASGGGLPIWNNPATVSVTSVDVSGGTTGLTFSGGPVGPGTGTITMAGALIVPNGGTGAISLTAGSVLLGDGTNAITPTANMVDGQLLIGNTGNPPSLATLTAGTGITINNTAGSIEIVAVGSGTVNSVTLDFNSALTPAPSDTGLRVWDPGLGAFQDRLTITNTGSFDIGGILNINNGGTGLETSDYTNGDILYYDVLNAELQTVPIGGAGEILTVDAISGFPKWAPAAGGGGIYGGSGSVLVNTTVTQTTNTLDFQNQGDGFTSFTATSGIPTGDHYGVKIVNSKNLAGSVSTGLDVVVNGASNNANVGIDVVVGGSVGLGNRGLQLRSMDVTSGTNIGLFAQAGNGVTGSHAIVTTSGNSGFGTGAPIPEAIVEIASITQGLLIPRWTTVQETTNTGGWGSGEEGMTWFNTTTKQFMGWNGTASVILG